MLWLNVPLSMFASESSHTVVSRASLSDTAVINILKPTTSQEDLIFDDPQLRYKREVNTSPGLLDRLLAIIASFLFENAGVNNIDRARQLLMWTVVIISISVVIWLLARSDIGLLTKGGSKKTGFNFSDLTEDLSDINYTKRISEALSDNNYRLAIRWHYLEVLYQLDKNGVIVFAPHKTNIDYRYELKDKTMAALFADLSRIYDYVWYGQFVIDQSWYSKNAEQFSGFKKQVYV